MFTFSFRVPTWRLIPDQFKWCSAGAAIVAIVVIGGCRCISVPHGCVASCACTSVWLGTGFSHRWTEGKRAAVFCHCG